MNGICALCQKTSILIQSHIIPKFVYKWLKNTSATGYLRFGKNPNKRAQDGFKENLLCRNCEDTFNKWETEFATNIFHPFVANTSNSYEYRSWFLKFVVSLSWRSLLYFEKFGLPHFTKSQINEVDQALETWRLFLLGQIKHPGKYQQHVLPIDIVSGSSMPGLPTNINRYFLRSVDIDPVAGSHQALVYVKIPYFIFIGGIQIKPEQWKNTMIHVHKGILGKSNYVVPKSFGDYIIDKAKKVGDIYKSISKCQKNKIEKIVMADLDKAINSETFKIMQADIELFGDEAFGQ